MITLNIFLHLALEYVGVFLTQSNFGTQRSKVVNRAALVDIAAAAVLGLFDNLVGLSLSFNEV